MGIEFTALDSTTLRPSPVGLIPVRVEVPEHWEFFGFHMGTVFALWGLFTAALTFKGKPAPRIFEDRQYGVITIAEARRAITAARSRFDRIVSSPLERARETFTFEERPNHIQGVDFDDPEILREKLERFAQFVEIAAQNGADSIQWS